MAVIEVSRLSYTYPGSASPALKNISLQVNAGQVVAVIGANNAGKSTLCLALAGLIPHLFHGQMEGAVRLAGLDTRTHSPGQLAGRVGLVLQNPANQLSGMGYTVYEEVAFGLGNLGVPRSQMPGRIEQALQQVGLESLSKRSPLTLSSGQQQRLALASVLALKPDVLVLDEPTAMLDPQGSRAIFGVIENLSRLGTTIVIVEHRLEWIAEYAGRVILLAEGEILLDGAPDAVLASTELVQAGVGWTRYTLAAHLGRKRTLWPAGRVLPVGLEQAVQGFQECQEQRRADTA